MWSYPESRHAGDRCPAKIMKTPAGDTGLPIELWLRMDKVAEGLVAGAECVRTRSRPCVQHPHCYVGQVDQVWLAVLRSGARDGPNLLLEIELIPGHLGDFLPALRCQGEKLNDAAVGSPDLPGCFGDATELVIAQHTVPRDLAGGLLDALTWRAIDDRPAYAPGEEGLCHLQGLVGGHWRAAIDDLTDELDNVASRHIVNRPRTPAAHDLAFQDAADLAGGAPLRDVLLDECINEIVDSIGHEPAPRLALLGSRITPFGSRHEHPLGLLSGDMQRDAAIGPDGVLAQPRARSSGPVEDDEHLAPRRRHLHAEAW